MEAFFYINEKPEIMADVARRLVTNFFFYSLRKCPIKVFPLVALLCTRKLQNWDNNHLYGARLCLHLANANFMETEVTGGNEDKLIRTVLDTQYDRKSGHMI